jgi:hypothetical protein
MNEFINVKTKRFENFLESQRQLKYSSWVHFEPLDSTYGEVTIVISAIDKPLEIRVFLKKYAWKREIDTDLIAFDYSEVKDFLWKNKVRKVRHIATLK